MSEGHKHVSSNSSLREMRDKKSPDIGGHSMEEYEIDANLATASVSKREATGLPMGSKGCIL